MSTWKLTKKLKETHLTSPFKQSHHDKDKNREKDKDKEKEKHGHGNGNGTGSSSSSVTNVSIRSSKSGSGTITTSTAGASALALPSVVTGHSSFEESRSSNDYDIKIASSNTPMSRSFEEPSNELRQPTRSSVSTAKNSNGTTTPVSSSASIHTVSSNNNSAGASASKNYSALSSGSGQAVSSTTLGHTTSSITPGLLTVAVSKATGLSLPHGYSWPTAYLDFYKTSASSGTSGRGGGQKLGGGTSNQNTKTGAIASSLERQRGAGNEAGHGSGKPSATGSVRKLPIYLVLEFDKTQVLVDAAGGTVENPIFDKVSNFDVSRPENLSIQVFGKVPIDQSSVGSNTFVPARMSSSSVGRHSVDQESSGSPHSTNDKSAAGNSGSPSRKNEESDVNHKVRRFQEVFLGSCRLEVDDLRKGNFQGAVQLSSGTGSIYLSIEFKNRNKKHLTIDDFDLLKVVGKGSFGKVMQVRKVDTQRIYALKTIRKAHIVSRSEVNHTLAERTVLAQIDNPFIVPLKFSFQSPEKLYLVLAFVNGGELFHHLQREGRFDLNRSRFYTAELLCALECLHQYNVIYRDLKPENILLDYTGHIALCDFGLCKLNMTEEDKTNTFCGTPEYLAPELLLGKGYTKVVDWWTLGVLFYEMLTGLPPFYDQDTNEMYRKILKEPLRFPDDMDREAKSLLTGLLNRDPTKRLGVNGAGEIKAHPFFAQIDWKRLMNKKYASPYKPTVESATDTSNFDQEFTNEVPTDSVVDHDYYLSESVQKQFGGWTYVNNDSKLGSSGKW